MSHSSSPLGDKEQFKQERRKKKKKKGKAKGVEMETMISRWPSMKDPPPCAEAETSVNCVCWLLSIRYARLGIG
jgi:hypothetical protein